MEGLAKLRSRPAFLAIAIGCVNGLIWAAYFALVKHLGAFETLLVFLGGIPTAAFLAWMFITHYQARVALQKGIARKWDSTGRDRPVHWRRQNCCWLPCPIVSLFSGLLAGVGLLTSGAHREWIHPDQIVLMMVVPTTTFGIGLVSMKNRAVGRRAGTVAIAAAVASVAIAALLGLLGYLTYPWFASTTTK